MKPQQLTALYPWAKHELILPFAETFSDEQWQMIAQSDFPELIEEIDPILITSFLITSESFAKQGQLIPQVLASFCKVFEVQASKMKFNLQDVLSWLGKDLQQYVERDLGAYPPQIASGKMDSLVHLLSPDEARNRMAQPLVSTDSNLHQKDIRTLYRTRKITLEAFINIITDTLNPSKKTYPEWIGDHVALQDLVDQMTDEQVALLPKILSEDLFQNKELTCSFLRTMLSQVVDNILEYPIETFAVLVVHVQGHFMQAASQKVLTLGKNTMDHINHMTDVLSIESKKPITHSLIERYVSKYQDKPIPPNEVPEALDLAFRNAAFAGNYWDLVALKLLVKDINLRGGQSGKTALHRAVENTHTTGAPLCFDLLANDPKIDFSVQDNDGKTALEYWDFKRFPDKRLADILTSIKAKRVAEAKPEKKPEDDKKPRTSISAALLASFSALGVGQPSPTKKKGEKRVQETKQPSM